MGHKCEALPIEDSTGRLLSSKAILLFPAAVRDVVLRRVSVNDRNDL